MRKFWFCCKAAVTRLKAAPMIEKRARVLTIDASAPHGRPAFCCARSLRREQEFVGDLPVVPEGANRWE
jgi:hypothetical protein